MATKEAIEQALVETQIANWKSDGVGAMDPELLESMVSADPTLGEATNVDDKMGQAFVEDDDEMIPIYSTFDGTKSIVLVSMLGKQMRKRYDREDAEVPSSMWGKHAFSLAQTLHGKEVQGNMLKLKCMYHADHPMRDELNAMGVMMQCRKANIPTESDVLQHAENRHPKEYKVVRTTLDRRERAEDREMQRELSKQLGEIAKAAAPKRGRPTKENE